jgi:hypothetical protein
MSAVVVHEVVHEVEALFNSLMTFIEPFPIGLAITLISAAALRKKAQSQPAPSPLPAS